MLPLWLIHFSFTPFFPLGEISLPDCLCHAEEGATYVYVSALSSVMDIDSLQVEPVTPADWILLQQKADWLESGGFLQQVSLVYSNQIMPLHLGSLGVAQVRVLPSNFVSKHDSPWPTEDNLLMETDPPRCFRLVADTHIEIAPKLPTIARGQTLKIVPSREDYTEPMLSLARELEVSMIRIQPCSVAIHPKTIVQFTQHWSQDDRVRYASIVASRASDDSRSVTGPHIVQVLTSEAIPEDSIGKWHSECNIRRECGSRM
jgi:hypothetical protein